MPARLVQTRPTGHDRARGLVSNRASGRRVDARTYAPPPRLSDVVAAYWVGQWDLRGQDPHVTALLGDPCVHIVFEDSDGPSAGSRVVGVWTRLWERRLEGKGRVLGVKLRAGAVRAFLPESARHLRNQLVPLQNVFGAEARRIAEEVWRAIDDAAAFSAVETWLEPRRRRDPAVRQAIALVDHIVAHPEVTGVERLAERVGSAPRAIQRLFRDYVGASPKWVIRRNRLQEAALRIERGELRSLAALAADLGYVDQAHLARDFKAAVGKSPTAFASSVHASEPSS